MEYKKDKFEYLVEKGLTQAEISRELEIPPTTAIYWLNKFDLKPIKKTYKGSSIFKEEKLKLVVESSTTHKEVCVKLGILNRAKAYQIYKKKIEEFNISTDHFNSTGKGVKKPRISDDDILTYDRFKTGIKENTKTLKRAMVNKGLNSNLCSECGITNWQGKDLTMQIDHINGDPLDNNLSNLRFICPNCHSQTSTFVGNKNKYKNLDDEELSLLNKIGDKEFKKIRNSSYRRRIGLNIIEYFNYRQNKKSESEGNRKALRSHKYTGKNRRKCDRPPYDQLLQEIKDLGYRGTGRKYGVSDNAIRKWVRWYEKYES